MTRAYDSELLGVMGNLIDKIENKIQEAEDKRHELKSETELIFFTIKIQILQDVLGYVFDALSDLGIYDEFVLE